MRARQQLDRLADVGTSVCLLRETLCSQTLTTRMMRLRLLQPVQTSRQNSAGSASGKALNGHSKAESKNATNGSSAHMTAAKSAVTKPEAKELTHSLLVLCVELKLSSSPFSSSCRRKLAARVSVRRRF